MGNNGFMINTIKLKGNMIKLTRGTKNRLYIMLRVLIWWKWYKVIGRDTIKDNIDTFNRDIK